MLKQCIVQTVILTNFSDSGPGTLRAECNDGACNENMYCDGYTCVCMPGYVSNYDGTKCTLEVFGGSVLSLKSF